MPALLLEEVAGRSGLVFAHDPVRRGDFLFPEINGAGCALVDVDNDGFLDAYLVQSGRDLRDPAAAARPNRLFHNRGDGTFEDVTEGSGAGDTGYGQGVAVGDYDNDGLIDLYVANVGGPSVLLHNDGDLTFTDVTVAAGVGNGGWVITPAFLDYDNDGWLDLFATRYVDWTPATDIACRGSTGGRDYCGPRAYRPTPPILYRNNGDGTFSDVSAAAGIDRVFGAGMGILTADFDDDGLVDVYVANDSFPNQLWINRGDGSFTDEALERGCAVSGRGSPLASMGTNAEDLDRDGDLDLFTTNYQAQGAILYRQTAEGTFDDVSMVTGLYRATADRTGFGAVFFDLFNDGGMAVFIGNGAAVMGGRRDAEASPYSQRDSLLLWSFAEQTFTDVSERLGAEGPASVTRGVAAGDIDNDGDVDLLVSSNGGRARLFRNTAARGHWLLIRCLDRSGRRDAIGAAVVVTAAGIRRRRDVIVNHSYGSASDARLHFGLGDASRADVTVRWPGGAQRSWSAVAADQVFVAEHPEAR